MKKFRDKKNLIISPFATFCRWCRDQHIQKLYESIPETTEEKPFQESEDLFADEEDIEPPPASAPKLDETFDEDQEIESSENISSLGFLTPAEENEKERRDHLNGLLKASKLGVECKYTNHQPYDEMPDREKRRLKEIAGAGVASVIHTVLGNKEDDAKFWNELKSSPYVDKLLTSEPLSSKHMSEIIMACNNAENRDHRTEILSLAAMTTKWSTIKKLNIVKIPGTDKDPKDFEYSDEFESTKVRFNPVITENMYIKARQHYRVSNESRNQILNYLSVTLQY